ncbi:glycerophosphodiester phosphodiesterase family protein [Zunongwangia endophytica]|uniref:glycerophosphodiester phosphodiesterase family protein n=1 Tax=Zunongwangia endophytica TaxID=1808945 RepID=UPI0025B4AA7F|nr:glycerophosphodiester phosphodiesterase family protein [Zunongwangia endophytica]MDN3596953.1 glycerophosphodiester phosphodiesterase family protein [Zunongwangia endophytica]
MGVDIIEVDLRTTKDGHLVLMHDSKIDRTTTGNGEVEEMTLAEIRQYHLKSSSGKISEESVPTFEEFLKITKGKIMVDLDMKTDNVEGILTNVAKNAIDNEVLYFDNDYNQLNKIQNLKKSAQLMPRAYSYQMADSAITRFKPAVIHIDDKFYTSKVVELIKNNNAKIWINTLGKFDSEIREGEIENVMKKILKNGANIIQTDEPEKLLEFLKSKNLHN